MKWFKRLSFFFSARFPQKTNLCYEKDGVWAVFKELWQPDEVTEEWIYPKVPHYRKGEMHAVESQSSKPSDVA